MGDIYANSKHYRPEVYENRVGAVGINIGGTDWLGLGQLTEGAVGCGAKPVCIALGKNSQCAKDKAAYNACVQQSMQIQQQQVAIANQTAQRQAEQKRRNTMIAVISLVSVAVLITIMVLLKKRK